MATWPEHCFKAYDIRGLAHGDGSGELTTAFAERLGQALGTYLGQHGWPWAVTFAPPAQPLRTR